MSESGSDHIPIRYSDSVQWEELKEQAAHLISLGEHTDRSICEMLSLQPIDLVRMRSDRRFMERVAEIKEDVNWTLLRQGIANKQNRVNELNRRHKLLNQIIMERSQDPQLANVPGGKTGLITVEYKAGGRLGWQEEFKVDQGLLAEMRAIEFQAAKEMGQISDKVDINMTSRAVTASVVGEIEKYAHIFENALQQVVTLNSDEYKEAPGEDSKAE